MKGRNVTMLTLAIGSALQFGAAAQASAQQIELFQWSGRVDREIQLTINGRNVTTQTFGNSEPRQRRAAVTSAVPQRDGQVSLQLSEGRGQVDVIQQPNAANGFTSIIRIRDPQSGAGDYRMTGIWQPVAGGEVGPPYGRGRGRGRDRNDDRGVGDRNNNNNDRNTRSRLALRWSGDVDDNLEIRLRPGGVDYRTIRGNTPLRIQSSFSGIPQGAVELIVSPNPGRGQVFVTQQPSAQNGYTAVLRIRDPEPGYGHYTFDLTWR